LRAVLERRTVRLIVDKLVAESPKGSFYSPPLVEEMTEKLAIFDMMQLGDRILSDKTTAFPTSYSLIQKYCSAEVLEQ